MKRNPIHRALTMLACLLWLFSAKAQMNAEQLTAIGRNVMSMDDYMLAIQYFNSAIKAKPQVYDPYYLRAYAKFQLEDLKGAEADCTRAIEIHEYKTDAYKLRGFVRQLMGKDSLAIKDFDRGLHLLPLDRDFMYFKAIAQTSLKDFDGATATFDTLLRAYNRYEDAYTARANLNMQKGDTVAALADINKSLEISANLVNSYLLRAEINANRKKWQDAADDMDSAIRLEPQNTDFYVNRAFIRYNNEDYFGAMADYNYAIELDPNKESALFNRALLRFEVRDLRNSVADLTRVLQLDPDNFHATYNRGLIYLQLKEYANAINDFDQIIKRFPRFYPVYYAKAEANQHLGNTRAAFENYYYAEDLIKRYVHNPDTNPLDKPAIAPGSSNRHGTGHADDESEIDVMNRFNQLVTENTATDTSIDFDERIKGKVQNRQVRVEPEPMYAITLFDSPNSLRTYSNYFRELDDLNQKGYIPETLYLSNSQSALSEDRIHSLFTLLERYNAIVDSDNVRPVDYLARGVIHLTLKNYASALDDLDKALKMNPRFTTAYMARGVAHWLLSQHPETTDPTLTRLGTGAAISDFDAALKLNPRLVYAWFDKGNIYYASEDYTSALECYSHVLEIDPSMGEALFNRALVYLQSGNKQKALADLSKAGELGVVPAYRLLKEMK